MHVCTLLPHVHAKFASPSDATLTAVMNQRWEAVGAARAAKASAGAKGRNADLYERGNRGPAASEAAPAFPAPAAFNEEVSE